MKRFIGIVLLAFVPLLSLACTAPAPVTGTPPSGTKATSPAKAEVWQEKWDRTVAAGKKEGEAMVFATLGAGSTQQLNAAFKEKFGIQLNFVTVGRGPELTERILREGRAGLHTVDVIITGATTLVASMKPNGFVDQLEPVLVLPEVLDSKAWRGGTPFIDKDRKIVPLIASFLRHVTRNTNLVKEGEIKSFQDLLNPKWKGQIILNDPTQSGAGNSWVSLMADTWGQERTRDYLKQLARQEPVITRDGRLQVETLSRGKYALGIATRVEVTGEFLALGAPIAPVRTVEGGTITGSGGVLSLPTNRPHPNAAAVLTNWLMTKDGQAVFANGFGSPAARLDVPPPAGFNPALLPEPGEPQQIEDEEGLKVKGGVLIELAKEGLATLFK